METVYVEGLQMLLTRIADHPWPLAICFAAVMVGLTCLGSETTKTASNRKAAKLEQARLHRVMRARLPEQLPGPMIKVPAMIADGMMQPDAEPSACRESDRLMTAQKEFDFARRWVDLTPEMIEKMKTDYPVIANPVTPTQGGCVDLELKALGVVNVCPTDN